MIEVSAVLLCGGESRRMGRDKATLIWRGRPLWELQLEKLRAVAPAEIFVSARTDPPWRPNDCPFVPDELPSRGPLSGIVAALSRCHTSRHLLVLAIDLPLLPSDELRETIANCRDDAGCIPSRENGLEPTAAVFPRQSLTEARAALAGDNYSLRSLAKQLIRAQKMSLRRIAPENFRCYQNLNSPNDLT